MSIALIVFLVVYLGMILGSLPGLKVDRATVALGGAIALLAFGNMDQSQALATIDFGTIGMLFGLMLISVQFEMSGLYGVVSSTIARYQFSPPLLLALLIALVGVMSAFLTNDVVAVAMTPVVLTIVLQRGLNPLPFLLSIAMAANAGSVATIIGSPQNMLIAQRLHMTFMDYLVYAAVPALLSLVVVWGVLVFFYKGRWLCSSRDTAQSPPNEEITIDRWESVKGLLVLGFVLYAFVFTHWDRGLVAATAGVLLLFNGHFMSRSMLQRVDWNLLILFAGLFVVNGAFELTGLPTRIVAILGQWGINLHDVDMLFVLTAILSDLVSNVPTVMVLLPYTGHDALAGPMLALSSGLASNLVIVGSLANIIVVDAAGAKGTPISFGAFAKVGIPVTLTTLAIAFCWIRLVVAG